jgi:hypothetical protein
MATTVKAEVTLTPEGPLTHTGNGRTFTRGQRIVTTNPADILYYQRQKGFLVKVLSGAPSKPARGPRGVSSDVEELDEEVMQPKAKAKGSIQPEPVVESPADGDLTEDELNTQTKGSLLELIESEGLNLDVNQSSSKADIIQAILKAGKKKKK